MVPRLALAALALLLVPPIVGLPASQLQLDAQNFGAGNVGTSIVYPIATGNLVDVDNWSSTVEAARYDNQPSLGNATWFLELTSTYLVDLDSAGEWAFQVRLGGASIANCSWRVPTYNANAAALQDPQLAIEVTVFCRVAAPAFGPISLSATRTVASGTPDSIVHGQTAFRIERRDLVLLPDLSNLNASLAEHRALSPEYTAAEARGNWLSALGDIAWLLWIIAFVLTRFIRATIMRVLADLVGFGLQALPIPAGQLELLLLAPLLAVGWDVFRYLEEPQ